MAQAGTLGRKAAMGSILTVSAKGGHLAAARGELICDFRYAAGEGQAGWAHGVQSTYYYPSKEALLRLSCMILAIRLHWRR